MVGWTIVCTQGHEWCLEHPKPAPVQDAPCAICEQEIKWDSGMMLEGKRVHIGCGWRTDR